ncbi:MAG TPA: TraR/DksA C4-type zinc finger protein [Chitinophagaceae bacterium]|nr:TraR/DksA C4-type zinc finger protein [Chitinophagaceae bacterium]
MATKKPAPKKAAKPAAKPAAKKAAPAKKAAAKPVAKKSVHAPAKKAASKPAPKKAAPVKKAAAKPVAKQPAKVVEKKAAPHPAKPAAKHAPAVKEAAEQPKVQPQPVKKPEPPKEVKVPKTTIKTSVPYTPDYKPLEQRQNSSKNNDPLIRYSDADLTEFRELIGKKLEAAKKELNYLQGLITRTDEMGGDESENRYMTMEDGSMSMEREQLSQMASRQITYIDHLEKALIRIENKTYGICRVTGKLIDKARLRAVPHATLSLEAKLGLVKSSNEQ